MCKYAMNINQKRSIFRYQMHFFFWFHFSFYKQTVSMHLNLHRE